MKVFVVATRSEDHKPEDFAPHLEAESNHALGLYRDEKIREIYSRADGKGALLVVEADNEDHAIEILSGLPFARMGMLSFQAFGAKPYRGIVAHL